jgi:hypothetical protein
MYCKTFWKWRGMGNGACPHWKCVEARVFLAAAAGKDRYESRFRHCPGGADPVVRAGPPGPAAAPGTKFGAKRTGRRGRRPRTRGPPTGFSRVSAPHGWSGRAHRCEPQTLPWHAAFASGRGAGAVLIHTTYDELWQMPSTSGAGCGNGRYGYLSAFRLCLRSIARER